MWNQIFGVGDLDGAAFTKFVAKMGVERGMLEAPEIDPDAMEIRDPKMTLNLRNVHLEFLTVPRRKRIAFVRDHVLQVMAPISDVSSWRAVQASLVPVIRHAGYLQNVQLTTTIANNGAPVDPLPCKCIAPNLYVTIAIDEPARMMLAAAHHLAEWKVSFEEALAVAEKNLTAMPHGVRPLAPGLWAFATTDAYTTARIVLPSLLQQICPNPLVAIPTRDVLMLADASNEEARDMLMLMLSMPDENERYPITRSIYQLQGDRLDLWLPTSNNDEYLAQYRRATLAETISIYREERLLREQLSSDDDHYAKLGVLEADDGSITTITEWISGVTSLLPRAHVIHFVDPTTENEPVYSVKWSVVEKAGLLTPTGSLIRRWRTGVFPSTAWLEANCVKAN